jgi:uncharacterized protein (TIGR02757 family)
LGLPHLRRSQRCFRKGLILRNHPLLTRQSLETLRRRTLRDALEHPDPVWLVRRYGQVSDREIVGLLVACLAYGKVKQILLSAGAAVALLGSEPAAYVLAQSRAELHKTFAGFKHRFTTGAELADLLFGCAELVRSHGSLNACFVKGLNPQQADVVPALAAFVDELKAAAGFPDAHHLLPSPKLGSACKRLMLYLRWMVRSDSIDPGGWEGVPAQMLVVPLDVHLHRFGQRYGLLTRKHPDLASARELTAAFRCFAPDDPLRYDFAVMHTAISAR